MMSYGSGDRRKPMFRLGFLGDRGRLIQWLHKKSVTKFNLLIQFMHLKTSSFKEGTINTSIYVMVQFYPWFSFYFPLFLTHYHSLLYTKTKENKN